MVSRQNILQSYIAISFLISLVHTNQLYYIVPSSSIPCPKHICYTLSYFINNITFNSSNATFMFLPGSHRLDSTLVFNGMKDLVLCCRFANILCSGTDASLELSNIDHAELSGIHFIECGGNKIESVRDLLIRNIKFQGFQGKTTLEVIQSTIVAHQSSFCFDNEDNLCVTFSSKCTQHGGAINMKQSTVNLVDCIFENNTAKYGGAIYGESMIKLKITDSKFVGNKAIPIDGTYILVVSYNMYRPRRVHCL